MKNQLPDGLEQNRLRLTTNLSKARMSAGEGGEWSPKRKKEGSNSVFLAVRKRYASMVMVEFRKSSIGRDSTPAFAVLWLSEIADEEEKTVTLKVWKGGKKNLARAKSCCDYSGLEKDEQTLGEIELSVKFWRGLSGYHSSHASSSKNGDVRDIMECLDTINDEKLGREEGADNEGTDDEDGDGEEEDSESGEEDEEDRGTTDAAHKKLFKHRNLPGQDTDTSSSSEEEEESNASGLNKIKQPFKKLKKSETVENITGAAGKATGTSGHNDPDDGRRGLRAQIRDYKDHEKQLHRKNRGIMQWKSARTLDWGVGKMKRLADRVGEKAFDHGDKDVGIETEV